MCLPGRWVSPLKECLKLNPKPFWLKPEAHSNSATAPLSKQTCTMAPKAMKAAAKSTAMSQSGITAAIATATGLKAADCKNVLASLAAVGTKEVKTTGKFTVPGLAMLKLKLKPATKAGKREMFGKVMVVKAKPAKKVVKAFAVAALKKSI